MLESAWGIHYETLQVGKAGASLIPFILLKDGAWECFGDGLRNVFGNKEKRGRQELQGSCVCLETSGDGPEGPGKPADINYILV